MYSRRITAVLTGALAATAVGLSIVTAGTAAADTADDAFIARMNAAGVSFSSPAAAVRAGNHVCEELAGGKASSDVADEIVGATDLTAKQAAFFVVAATKTYCPAYSTQLA